MKLGKKTKVEQDRENLSCNIILYNVQEPRTTNQEERWRDDREVCLELFNKILRVPIKEEDMKKIVRLGKMNSVQEGKPKPVLIQFRDRVLKNDYGILRKIKGC